MALVIAEYQFIWASVGAPGNTHDSALLMIPNVVQQVEDVEIPPLLVLPRLGNGAFQL